MMTAEEMRVITNEVNAEKERKFLAEVNDIIEKEIMPILKESASAGNSSAVYQMGDKGYGTSETVRETLKSIGYEIEPTKTYGGIRIKW